MQCTEIDQLIKKELLHHNFELLRQEVVFSMRNQSKGVQKKCGVSVSAFKDVQFQSTSEPESESAVEQAKDPTFETPVAIKE